MNIKKTYENSHTIVTVISNKFAIFKKIKIAKMSIIVKIFRCVISLSILFTYRKIFTIIKILAFFFLSYDSLHSNLLSITWFWRKIALHIPLHKKWSFLLKNSSVTVTKTAENCRFDHIYWRNPSWKTSFSVQCSEPCQTPNMEFFVKIFNGLAWQGLLFRMSSI